MPLTRDCVLCFLFGDDVCTQVIIKLFMALNTLYLPIYLSSAVQVLEKNVNVNRFAFVSLSSLLSGLPDPFPRISSVCPFLSTRSLISMIILKNYLFSSVSVCIVIVLRRFLFSRCV